MRLDGDLLSERENGGVFANRLFRSIELFEGDGGLNTLRQLLASFN